MRKVFYFILFSPVMVFTDCNDANRSIEFEDRSFKDYCIENFDRNGDGVISMNEAKEVISISVISLGIKSLVGIEYFVNLERLECCDNMLTDFDVCKLRKLKLLNCGDNDLKSIDVSQNTALQHLICCANHLCALDIRRNIALELLYCDKNELTNLDLGKNVDLQKLECDYNRLTSIDLAVNTRLKVLTCYDNPELKEILLPQGVDLEVLYCENTQAEIKCSH